MYIVTGGAGFIGSALIWALNQRGINDIIVVDQLGCDEKWKNLRALKFNDYIEINDFRALVAANSAKISESDVILHMGACSSTMESDASYLIDNNFNYTKELTGFALEHGIRFIYASSAATYGDGEEGYCDNEEGIDSLRPLNMYGYSKQIFDQWAYRSNLLGSIVGLKYTNVFGPNEWHKGDMRSLVCKAYDQICETGKLKLFKSHKEEYADGEQMRDFLYVKDAVKMVLHFVDNPNHNGLFNIGSGKAETWNKLAEAIFAGMNQDINIEYIDMPESLRDKYQYYTKAEMEKFYSTGYSEEATPLRDAVIDYVQQHLIPAKHLGD